MYVFPCKYWLAKDRGEGLTARVFNVIDADTINISRKVYTHARTHTLFLTLWHIADAGAFAKSRASFHHFWLSVMKTGGCVFVVSRMWTTCEHLLMSFWSSTGVEADPTARPVAWIALKHDPHPMTLPSVSLNRMTWVCYCHCAAGSVWQSCSHCSHELTRWNICCCPKCLRLMLGHKFASVIWKCPTGCQFSCNFFLGIFFKSLTCHSVAWQFQCMSHPRQKHKHAVAFIIVFACPWYFQMCLVGSILRNIDKLYI